MRPHVWVNVAMSADGKLSTRERRQVKISGKEDFSRVDRLKSESDAIMVGIGTVLADDPSLTVKSPTLREMRTKRGVEENPVRVVVDSTLRCPADASVLHKGGGRRVIACTNRADPEKVTLLGEYATVIRAGGDRVDLKVLLSSLYDMGIRRLMVEGGGTLIWALFEADLVDELTCFVGNIIIGGASAPTLADGTGFTREDAFIRLDLESAVRIEEGVLLTWRVRR
ncbi:2,5-diamino-6-(ribosylamino)-4(3H)-pyrimidinone 5'-phosphate reductase [Methanolinea mesophila]|uniref:2,5-diamino-6-(ribosylamino)-4(3H)-pyrimidinone 5'-phosphate reductase n=1 Tax=Methanolinea mesophila TaxID=547055 RepID=UPI001AE5FB70|nr:2,5-diamino-6-(ribosylamino)-4(3H)-pyrimidinone 5'-phosphate reductase [Methanolinea mesophila]MBP1929369.1 2,5-diamino-6-(ribosylamino)-4(3H)-pyrimidinone 5'-phosphate reductase [Methanolinea mesophila]